MKLATYWRSTASYRVRIALGLKGIEATHRFVHLLRDGGEQHSEAYRLINPQGRVPIFELGDGSVLTQSSAIIEYLEEAFPNPALLPPDVVARAKIRAVAAIVGCDIHPLHNLATLSYLRQNFGRTEADIRDWITHWIDLGLAAVEGLIGEDEFCFGSTPSLADVFLVPQLYAAKRFGVPLERYFKIRRVDALCETLPAFRDAHPSNQLDAEGAVSR